MRIRLTDADQKKFGAPEWLELDTDAFSVMEAEVLAKAEISSAEGLALLRGWPGERDGAPILDDNGAVVRQTTPRGWHVRVWIALRRCGIHVDYETCDFSLVGMEVEYDPPEVEDVDDEGKDDPSENLEPSMTP